MSKNNNIKVSVSAIIYNDQNEILLGLRNGSRWRDFFDLPGGKLEFGEHPNIALIREVKEETNLDVEIEDNFVAYNSNVVEDRHYLTLFLKAKIKNNSPELTNLEPHKHEYFKWYDIYNLPSPLLMSIEEFLPNYLV